MTFEPDDDFALSLLVDADPTGMTREDLVELVEDLQRALAVRMRQANSNRKPDRRTIRASPEADFTIAFDGGSLGNPGLGYGSFEVATPAGSVAAEQVKFGPDMTNNQAEFRALIAGLEALLAITGDKASKTSVAVRGDSRLVIRGLTGEWKVKHPGLQPLHRQARALLDRFESVDLAWHSRRESVRAFRH